MPKGADFGYGMATAASIPAGGTAGSQEGTQIIPNVREKFSQKSSKAHANALVQRVKGATAAGLISEDFSNAVRDRVAGKIGGQSGN